MDMFISTAPSPKPPSSEYNIRNKREWNSVYQVLENARSQYQSKRGAVGKLNFHLRKGADNIAPVANAVRIASKLAPKDAFATPILGTITLLLDVRQHLGEIRSVGMACLSTLSTRPSRTLLFVANRLWRDSVTSLASFQILNCIFNVSKGTRISKMRQSV
jgi:hypothetical protein